MTKKKSAPAQAGTEGKEGSAAVPQKAAQAARPAGAERRRGKSSSEEKHSSSANSAEAAKPAEAPKPAEPSKPLETPAAAEAEKPADAQKPAEAPAAADAAKPAAAPAPSGVSAAAASPAKSAEEPHPAPDASGAPAEAPKPSAAPEAKAPANGGARPGVVSVKSRLRALGITGSREQKQESAPSASVRERVRALIRLVSRGVYGRSDTVKALVLGVLAGENVFLFGPPGTGKSMLSRRMTGMFTGARFFEHLMHRFCTPEELFGPVSLKELKEDRYVRKTDGYLADAEIAFLDEIWKSSPAVLNTLLTLVNEHSFTNGTKVIKAPLLSLISASNELPRPEDGLTALYDRFIVRLVVSPIEEHDVFLSFLKGSSRESPLDLVRGDDVPLSPEEYRSWLAREKEVRVSDSCAEAVWNIRSAITKSRRPLPEEEAAAGMESASPFDGSEDAEADPEQYLYSYVSDRRWLRAVSLVKAAAFLNGAEETEPKDLLVLSNVLWSIPGERDLVKKLVLSEALRAVGESGSGGITEELKKKAAELNNAGSFLRKAADGIERFGMRCRFLPDGRCAVMLDPAAFSSAERLFGPAEEIRAPDGSFYAEGVEQNVASDEFHIKSGAFVTILARAHIVEGGECPGEPQGALSLSKYEYVIQGPDPFVRLADYGDLPLSVAMSVYRGNGYQLPIHARLNTYIRMPGAEAKEGKSWVNADTVRCAIDFQGVFSKELLNAAHSCSLLLRVFTSPVIKPAELSPESRDPITADLLDTWGGFLKKAGVPPVIRLLQGTGFGHTSALALGELPEMPVGQICDVEVIERFLPDTGKFVLFEKSTYMKYFAEELKRMSLQEGSAVSLDCYDSPAGKQLFIGDLPCFISDGSLPEDAMPSGKKGENGGSPLGKAGSLLHSILSVGLGAGGDQIHAIIEQIIPERGIILVSVNCAPKCWGRTVISLTESGFPDKVIDRNLNVGATVTGSDVLSFIDAGGRKIGTSALSGLGARLSQFTSAAARYRGMAAEGAGFFAEIESMARKAEKSEQDLKDDIFLSDDDRAALLRAYEEKSSELISVCRSIQKLTATVDAMVLAPNPENADGGSNN